MSRIFFPTKIKIDEESKAEWQSLLNPSDERLGVYCTVFMSQDLTRGEKKLEYLKQRNLRQSIGYAEGGRLKSLTENPEISANRCQPWAGGKTQ